MPVKRVVSRHTQCLTFSLTHAFLFYVVYIPMRLCFVMLNVLCAVSVSATVQSTDPTVVQVSRTSTLSGNPQLTLFSQ